MLRTILCAQNSSFSIGRNLRQLCPCQKHPSTKMATLLLRKTKSGCPLTGYPRRHPLTPSSCNTIIKASSVDRFPEALMFRITAERFFLSKMSVVWAPPHITKSSKCPLNCIIKMTFPNIMTAKSITVQVDFAAIFSYQPASTFLIASFEVVDNHLYSI